MTRLCIGVTNALHGGKANKRWQKNNGALTTQDVAMMLEAEYGLFSNFAAQISPEIGRELEEAYWGAIESVLARGGDVTPPLDRVAETIASKLQKAISSGDIESMGLGPGRVPTQAALLGVNHRFKSGFNNISSSQLQRFSSQQRKLPKGQRVRPVGDRRPSFMDTGMLVNSIKGWAD